LHTDVEVIKPLNELLSYEAVSGFETDTQISTSLMACEKGHRMFKEFLDDYSGLHFIRPDGSLDLTANVKRITDVCLEYGLIQNNAKQTINGFTLLPLDYLCPKDYRTKEIHVTNNTLCIHHFDGSWHTDEDIFVIQLSQRFANIPLSTYFIKFIGVVKYRGVKAALRETWGWTRRKRDLQDRRRQK